MVANSEPQRTDSYDPLTQRLADIERAQDENGRASKYPFVVSHNGVTDFSVVPSSSGDGTSDLFVGDGAGNPALRTRSVSGSSFKIVELFDASGHLMYSVDSLTGFGLGNPTIPFPYGGIESINLNGATSPGTATEFVSGRNWAYNSALWVGPRVRIAASTAVTVNMFATFIGGATTYTTTERVVSVGAGGVSITFPEFATYLAANDMAGSVNLAIRAYCSAGVGANAQITGTFFRGLGVSKGYVDNNLQAAL